MKKQTKKEILIIILRLTIIALVLIGIFSNGRDTSVYQLWYFTQQTNIFVALLMTFQIVLQILKLSGVKEKISSSNIFCYFRLAITFYITLTGIIFCFVLVPVAIITQSKLAATLYFRDIVLHVFVPVMTVIDYFSVGKKIALKRIDAVLFLIYPIVYEISVFIRARVSSVVFAGGDNSKYPYFFIDPTFNNQGWLAVIGYSLLCLVLFYLIGLIYVDISNRQKFGNKKTS